ncbi:MAG: RagB/SusD family nutrient uptake outer membrane protein [Bacteroidota bacterium]
MKKYKLIMLLLISIGFSACEDKILNLESLTSPVDATFYTNEAELDLALTGVYNTLILTSWYTTSIQTLMDNSATDIGIVRGDGAGSYQELGAGIHSSMSAGFQWSYSHYYRGIARANSLLENMVRAKEVVDEEKYDDIKAQALVVRAINYMYLTELFGDVPYIDKVINDPKDGVILRTPKETIVTSLLEDLQLASELLPLTRPDSEKGKITKAVALTLRARIALYNKKYSEAASSAGAVMDMESASGLALHPDYGELFAQAGQNSSEIMLIMPYKEEFLRSRWPTAQGSRNLGGYSTYVPTQSMIDSYEAIDGEPIDESGIYDPKNPFENRDPRLKASVVTPQSVWAGIIFDGHPDSLTFRNAAGEEVGANKDCRNASWPGAFCGYLWKKYTDEESQTMVDGYSYLNFTLMRYTEVLLIYAEAKIESGDIDPTVLNAINRIRSRAYGVDVSDTGNYPAIITTDQAELRKVIRRERKVELANEGFRLFDIRRWRIAEKVMPVVIYGRILDTSTATGVPQIDDDGFVSYAGIESQYDLNTDARFPNAQNRQFNPGRDYLCPIPQQEIDTYAGLGETLEQNPGY